MNGGTIIFVNKEKIYKKISLLNTKLITRYAIWDSEFGEATDRYNMNYEDARALWQLVGQGSKEIKIYIDKTDKIAGSNIYPRYVFADDVFINLEMLELGLLKVDLSDIDNSCKSELQDIALLVTPKARIEFFPK